MRIDPVLERQRVQSVGDAARRAEGGPSGANGRKSFADTLADVKRDRDVTFSRHAERRLAQRDVTVEGADLDRLADAVGAAEAKGARSTLVLMKGVAFVVAPRTRTVVTVIPDDQMKGSIFTSIDSAIVVDR